jgi:hypothetical protein
LAAEHAQYKGAFSQVLRMLLARPTANVNCHTAAGLTPLHYASVYGRMDIAMLLLKAGADSLAVDLYSRTPLVRPGLLSIHSRLLSPYIVPPVHCGRESNAAAANAKQAFTPQPPGFGLASWAPGIGGGA